MTTTVTKDGWVLEPATGDNIDQLMSWFSDKRSVSNWGGPEFRFPFTCRSFQEDVRWGKMATFCLRNPVGDFAAFGQCYDRKGRMNFARLVVHPKVRGQGVGKRLIEMLMMAGRDLLPFTEYSLFVFRYNTLALEYYKSRGFVVQDYPGDMPYADTCFYLTRC